MQQAVNLVAVSASYSLRPLTGVGDSGLQADLEKFLAPQTRLLRSVDWFSFSPSGEWNDPHDTVFSILDPQEIE